LQFAPKVTDQLTINTSQSFTLNQGKFYKTSAGGNWELEILHPDPNKYDANEINQLRQELLMTPWTLQINTLNPHGTAVAGIAAASENGQGIVGVAPEAKLAGIRLFGNTDPLNYNRDPSGRQSADALFDSRHKPEYLIIISRSIFLITVGVLNT
jgi:subtilisin family serine protease